MKAFPKLVMSLGVPRSGTTLVFNVLREILTRRDVEFRAINANYPETEAFFRRYRFRGNVLLHAHNVLPGVQKALTRRDVTAFFTTRDPRDVVVSMMQLHDYTFERCLELVEISFEQFRAARRFPRVTFIPYEHLMAAPGALIFQIGLRLGTFLPLVEVDEIRAQTSLEAHRRIMADVAAGTVEVQERRNPVRTLRESRTHFITDRHIQSGRPGRWREELDTAQRQVATERFRPLLTELGYEGV